MPLVFTRLLLLCALCCSVLTQAEQSPKPSYRYSDAHLHYVNFFQESDGIDALLKAMDQANVEHAMIAGLPVVKKWADTEPQKPKFVFADDARVYWYSLSDEIVARAVTGLPKSQRKRLHPFICGFNPTDKNAVRHVKRMLEWYPDLWEGIGEIITRHDDLTALIDGEPARANHPALTPIYKLAAKHDLPVMIHSNITSARIKEPLYLAELEEALRKNPNTRFIWAHAGTSNSINLRNDLHFLDEETERLLRTYPNLWIDLSWSVLEEHLLNSKEKIKTRWLKILQRHPDRFMLGSDLVGNFDRIGELLAEFDDVLDALNDEDARKLAHDNFLRVLPQRR
jgi:predicted TIM-barrel fold metal-dependent hydrolase